MLRGERGLAGKGISKGWLSPVTPLERDKPNELVHAGNEIKYSENPERSFFYYLFFISFGIFLKFVCKEVVACEELPGRRGAGAVAQGGLRGPTSPPLCFALLAKKN